MRFTFTPPAGPSSAPDAEGAIPPPARTYEVVEVLGRWYGPGYQCFKVRADDHGLYILRHHLGDDTWTLDSFRRDRAGVREK